MNFSDRMMTIKLYREWKAKKEEEDNVKLADSLETFLAFLEIKGLLINPEDYNADMDALLEEIEYEMDMLSGDMNEMYDTLNFRELFELKDSMHKRVKHLYDLNYDRARKSIRNERKTQDE